jgi:hypothetical protein
VQGDAYVDSLRRVGLKIPQPTTRCAAHRSSEVKRTLARSKKANIIVDKKPIEDSGICVENDAAELSIYTGANPVETVSKLGIPEKLGSISALRNVNLFNQLLT